MAFCALLILACGPLNWSFPWWVWVLCILCDYSYTRVRIVEDEE